MSTPAIIMMILGLGVTWGGAGCCISLALRKRNG